MSKLSLDILKLSIRERLDLISELWDSIPDADFEEGPSPEQMAEIKRRIRLIDEEPARTVTWEEISASIESRKRQ